MPRPELLNVLKMLTDIAAAEEHFRHHMVYKLLRKRVVNLSEVFNYNKLIN